MTENEIIKMLETEKAYMDRHGGKSQSEALEYAIEAVKEIRQYRAIGTVEEIKSMKENGAFSGIELAQIASMQMKLKEYQSICTIEEFKALKEKNTPKKGIPYTSSNNHKFVECPSCHKDMDLYYDFCQHCGQSVDWGKTKT